MKNKSLFLVSFLTLIVFWGCTTGNTSVLTQTSTIVKLLEKAQKYEASTIEVTRLTTEGQPYRIDRVVHQAKMIYEVRDGFFVLTYPAEKNDVKTYLPLSNLLSLSSIQDDGKLFQLYFHFR